MTTTNPALTPDRILDTDAKLQETLSLILDKPIRRQVWIFFLDANHRLTGPVIPLENYPSSPTAKSEFSPFGPVSFAHTFTLRLGEMLELVDGETLVLVWEDPDASNAEALKWARALAHETSAKGTSLRTQFVLNQRGFWQVAPDDLV